LFRSDEELAQVVASDWYPFAIAPDGMAGAYFDESGLYVVRHDGTEVSLAIEGVSSVAWGASQWRVMQGVSMVDPEQPFYLDKTDCETDVTIGDEGVMTAEFIEMYSHHHPLRYIRHNFPKDTPLRVIGGPLCRDAMERRVVFWQVEVYDQTGWIAEDRFSITSTD